MDANYTYPPLHLRRPEGVVQLLGRAGRRRRRGAVLNLPVLATVGLRTLMWSAAAFTLALALTRL